MSAPRRPRFVANPSASMATTASNCGRSSVAIGPRAPHEREQLVLRVLAARRSRRRSAARARRSARPATTMRSRSPAADRSEQRDALDQIVARRRETPGPSACRPTVCPDRPTRCSSVAIRCGDPIWQTRSTWPMSMPSSSDAVATSALQRAALEPRLGVEPPLLGQASVVRRHRVVAQAVAQVASQPLGEAPRVDEHERRPMFPDEIGEPVVVLLPDLARHHRFERRASAARSPDRARGGGLRRRWRNRGCGRPSSAAGWPTRNAGDGFDRAPASPRGRCAGAALPRPPRAARATAPGARRGACRSPRESRRR